MVLVLCPSCGRHAFGSEVACPHCGLAGRPTLLGLVTAVGLALAGCGGSTDTPSSAPSTSAAPSTSTTASGPATAEVAPALVTVYGPAPVRPESRQPQPSGSTAPAPPPVDVYGPPPRDPNQRK
jgi:hypothetical protein